MTVFSAKNKQDHTKAKAFLDPSGGVTLQRYDTLKYKQFDKLVDKQLGFFWRPEEVDIIRDANDFKLLTEHEQHIFTSNLKRQILLDSVQGRAPTEAFAPLVSLPEIEAWVQTWTFSETIHSRSYTHIIRNVYANPSEVFDDIMDIKEILDCADDISKNYDELIDLSLKYQLLGKGNHTINGKKVNVDVYEIKKALYKTLMSVNILEGVRFYVSFACSWAFAELKKMEGNAKIIKLIARDENTHLAASLNIIKKLVIEDKDFVKIRKSTEGQVIKMFMSAIKQEEEWADYLFKDGSMIGLNTNLLSDYVRWIGARRMRSAGYTAPYHVHQANPLPWTDKWIGGGNVQVAPQETEITSYIVGGVKQDVKENTFKGLSL